MRWLPAALLLLLASAVLGALTTRAQPVLQEYTVPAGSHPHDVAPATDGGIWWGQGVSPGTFASAVSGVRGARGFYPLKFSSAGSERSDAGGPAAPNAYTLG